LKSLVNEGKLKTCLQLHVHAPFFLAQETPSCYTDLSQYGAAS